jgi:hypothetical protein
MEAIFSSETSVSLQIIQLYNAEARTPHALGTFRRNISPSSSRSKNEPSKISAETTGKLKSSTRKMNKIFSSETSVSL